MPLVLRCEENDAIQNFRLPSEYKTKLRRMAALRDVTAASMLRECVEILLAEDEPSGAPQERENVFVAKHRRAAR